jgi:nicotinate-nucleotide adenylyltransferase
VQRLGILGGTFDPPHIGHLILAQYTMEALDLSAILFVPAGDHPFKGDNTRSQTHNRVAMTNLAIADNARFILSMVDLEREGPHYSADTVKILQRDYPNAQLYFVMGGDNLRALPTWTRARELYEGCRLAVMKRSDENISPDMHEAVLPGLKDQVDIVDAPLLGIWLSSTHVIERLQAGRSVRYLVPDPVLDYIRQHHLYQSHE